jgi:hypothetical protein
MIGNTVGHESQRTVFPGAQCYGCDKQTRVAWCPRSEYGNVVAMPIDYSENERVLVKELRDRFSAGQPCGCGGFRPQPSWRLCELTPQIQRA